MNIAAGKSKSTESYEYLCVWGRGVVRGLGITSKNNSVYK